MLLSNTNNKSILASSLPQWPIGWYIVARSKDLLPGNIIPGKISDHTFVLFRTKKGNIGAINSHCPHMGADLIHGEIIGENLRCPLHHWQLDIEGKVIEPNVNCHSDNPWSVKEKFGLIFLHFGKISLKNLPAPLHPEKYVWTTASPVELQTDWHSMVINGFDMQHLHAVHGRQLIEPARTLCVNNNRFELEYTSKVTGNSLSDRIMKFLSKNCIRVKQTCYGTIIIIESNLGKISTAAILGIISTRDGVKAYSAFGVFPGHFTRLRLFITRSLYASFLKKDFKILDNMRLRLDVEDEGVLGIAEFIKSLPKIEPE